MYIGTYVHMNVHCICAYVCIVHTDDSIMCVRLHMKAMVYTVVGMLFSLYVRMYS